MLDSISYDPHNPCQTFLPLGSNKFKSAADFLGAETRELERSGWHHSVRQPVDYDAVGDAMAGPSES